MPQPPADMTEIPMASEGRPISTGDRTAPALDTPLWRAPSGRADDPPLPGITRAGIDTTQRSLWALCRQPALAVPTRSAWAKAARADPAPVDGLEPCSSWNG